MANKLKERPIVLGSCVRNGAGYLPRYFEQVGGLAEHVRTHGFKFKHVALEGDSEDTTWADLVKYFTRVGSTYPVQLIHYEVGGRAYGSVDVADRWKQIARCWNHMWRRLNDGPPVGIFIYMEADLIWDPPTVWGLVEHVLDGVDAVAPMSMLRNSPHHVFWDTWGHRAGGLRFQNAPPYHPWLDPRKAIPPDCYDRERGLIKIDSAGSCGVFHGDIVRKCTFRDRDAMVGPSLYEEGFTFWLDPMLEVIHPNIHKGEV